MNWKEYEDAICDALLVAYPDAKIRRNVRLTGKQSRVKRQIDVLVEYFLLGKPAHIIVDAKSYNTLIDVKDVDSFIGMVQDLGAVEGILVTELGYTPAAINRAHNSTTEISLEIYNLKELQSFQGFVGIPFSNIHGVVLPAPFGWVIDATPREESLAMLYRRGLSLENAILENEFIYVNIKDKSRVIKSSLELLKIQNKSLRLTSPTAKITMEPVVIRDDERPTLLRRAELEIYPAPEYTGFVEFDDFIFFCVLFTPEAIQKRNVRKIQYILERVLPLDMTPAFTKQVEELEQALEKEKDITRNAAILAEQGKLLRQIKQFDKADEKLTKSLLLEPEGEYAYDNYNQIVISAIQAQRGRDVIFKALNDWYDSGLRTGGIILDIFIQLENRGNKELALEFIKQKLADFKKNDVVTSLIQYQLAQIYMIDNKPARAKQTFAKAKISLQKITAADDEIFQSIEEMLALLEN